MVVKADGSDQPFLRILLHEDSDSCVLAPGHFIIVVLRTEKRTYSLLFSARMSRGCETIRVSSNGIHITSFENQTHDMVLWSYRIIFTPNLYM
jgi:hypothetical protein